MGHACDPAGEDYPGGDHGGTHGRNFSGRKLSLDPGAIRQKTESDWLGCGGE
jgi:hypothetical protein